MKSYVKRKELMRKIIVSQTETMKQQSREIESLTDENLRLHTDYEKMNNVLAQFKELLDNFACQNNAYIKNRKRLKKIRRKIEKITRIKVR